VHPRLRSRAQRTRQWLVLAVCFGNIQERGRLCAVHRLSDRKVHSDNRRVDMHPLRYQHIRRHDWLDGMRSLHSWDIQLHHGSLEVFYLSRGRVC
jgi:hypothetical protein